MARNSRRLDICEAAIVLASRGGSHAVTHQGIDARLGIAKGSTSYYFRTRADLITAVADHVAAQSRTIFEDLLDRRSGDEGDGNSGVIEQYMDLLVGERREAYRARMALLLDADCGSAQRTALAECLFSFDSARDMYDDGRDDPAAAATALIDSLEGRLARLALFAAPDHPGEEMPIRAR